MMPAFTRTAMVNDASRGIGRAIATGLAKDGFSNAGNEKAAQGFVQNIEQLGGKAIAVQADGRLSLREGSPQAYTRILA